MLLCTTGLRTPAQFSESRGHSAAADCAEGVQTGSASSRTAHNLATCSSTNLDGKESMPKKKAFLCNVIWFPNQRATQTLAATKPDNQFLMTVWDIPEQSVQREEGIANAEVSVGKRCEDESCEQGSASKIDVALAMEPGEAGIFCQQVFLARRPAGTCAGFNSELQLRQLRGSCQVKLISLAAVQAQRSRRQLAM